MLLLLLMTFIGRRLRHAANAQCVVLVVVLLSFVVINQVIN